MVAAAQQTLPWSAYLPYFVARELARDPDSHLVGRTWHEPVVVLFADISGFTAISESLAAPGRGGAEELTGILNAYLAPAIALVESYGGSIGKLGGDALTAIFPYTPANRGPVAQRALACALAIQAHVARYTAITTSAGPFTLAMRIGLAAGPLLSTIVGDPQTRLELVLAGGVLVRAVAAEHAAQPGEVVVTEDLLDALGHTERLLRGQMVPPAPDRAASADDGRPTTGDGPAAAGESAGLRHLSSAGSGAGPQQPTQLFAVSRMALQPEPAPLPPITTLPIGAAQKAATFLPAVIARRIESGHASFVNEHRNVSVLFAAFRGCDADTNPDAAAWLQAYLSRIFQVVQRYGGYVNKVDMGDKGNSFLVLFGAPLSHEDDAARALQCALELQKVAIEAGSSGPDPLPTDPAAQERGGDRLPLTLHPASYTLRVGVTSGLVYCGQVGSASHREYTVIGDTVNLAARLMEAAAPGQILAAETTRRATGGRFHWQDAGELHVRGRAAPIAAGALIGAISAAYDSPMHVDLIGRGDVLDQLSRMLSQSLGGRGQVVGLAGEAGLGKSALAGAILDRAEQHGARCLRGECLSYRTASSYLVWQSVLRGLLAIEPSWPAERQIAQLSAAVEALDRRMAPRIPLLAAALGLPMAESALTLSLDQEVRKAAVETMVADMLAEASARRPLVILLESCDWIDPLSRDLLEAAARRSAALPVLFLLTYRNGPGSPEYEPSAQRVTRLPTFSEIRLGELSREASAQLIDEIAARLFGGGAAMPPLLIERITAQAQGNPFFIEELLSLIHDRQIAPDDTAALEQLELPDSLHSLILSRIDRLPESARTALKVASVIGREFDPEWLSGVYPPLGDPGQLTGRLEELRRSDLAVLDRPPPEFTYHFKHVLTREVAYTSLTRATRAELHERTGAFIEQRYAGSLDRHLDLLAYHYGLSNNQIKQREYLLRAGMAALDSGANESAIGFLRRLLPMLHRHERSAVLLKLGKACRIVGRWAEAEEAYQEALTLAPDRETVIRCRTMMGELLLRRGDFATARAWLELARGDAISCGDRQAEGEAIEHLGLVSWSQGDYASALSYLERALDHVGVQGENARTAQLLNNIGLIYWTRDDLARALDCFERCLRIAAAQGNRRFVGVAVGNMGNIYMVRGDYGRALDCYAQKLQCAVEVGDKLEIGISVDNLGTIYESVGEYARATACFLRSLDLALTLGDRLGVGLALLGAGSTALEAGRLDEADHLLERASALLRLIEAGADLSTCLYSQADLAARRGRSKEALGLLAEALLLAEAGSCRDVALRCRLLAAICERTLGRLSPTMAAAQVAPLLANAAGDAERAAIHYTLACVDGARAEDRATAARLYRALHARTPNNEYRRRYAELMGVTLPLPVPLPPLPGVVSEHSPDQAALLYRADLLLEIQEAEVG